jgi:hypothetical protein
MEACFSDKILGTEASLRLKMMRWMQRTDGLSEAPKTSALIKAQVASPTGHWSRGSDSHPVSQWLVGPLFGHRAACAPG